MFNRLIGNLPRKERDRTLVCCEQVELVFGDILSKPGQPIQHVYFPLTSFISQIATVGEHSSLETGLIGNEGVLGATLVLGVNSALLLARVQGPGMALRMTAGEFLNVSHDNPVLLHAFKRYLYVQMAQLSQTAVCTHFHMIESRLARWLLMAHDRAHADHFHLTHEFLASMLGVRRSAITIAAGALQKRKIISYSRGGITVLDRHDLEAASCECYQLGRSTYARIFSGADVPA
ncbi:MAG: Crp/Fnr family transcriptional regulator [bacterium]|nr:Crp/Fnr family transcriptional regulator [bacterium]